MASPYDVVVIGAGLGGLTAAALLARAGRKTLLIERNPSVGGAATTYKVGDLVVEASLHETADPQNPLEPKHQILERIGVLDAVQWVPTGPLYEVRGGPVGEPFVLPDDFAAAREALSARFPLAAAGVNRVLGDMERIATGLGTLSQGRDAFRDPREGLAALLKLAPALRDWRLSLSDVLERAFAGNEAVKCALAANLGYWHDDPCTMWWLFFAVAQGGYLGCGGRYIHGGAQRLSNAIARAFRAAGGELLLGHAAVEIRLGKDGRPASVVYEHKGERAEARTRAIACNAAPAVLATLLPERERALFDAAYGRRPQSISLFALTLGLSCRPSELGIRHYSNFLLPAWVKRLADYPANAAILAENPNGRAPIMALVDYSAIDSGLGGSPYPVSIVGTDRVANWVGLSEPAYREKRRRWMDAIIDALEHSFPGIGSRVVAWEFNTARSMRNYLNAPEGSIYGFAPTPPSRPIWRGFERSPQTPIPGLYLASCYAGSGGFTGAIRGGASAADRILATH